MIKLNLKNKRYGDFVVIEAIDKNNCGDIVWLCVCNKCKRYFCFSGESLYFGLIRKCRGCIVSFNRLDEHKIFYETIRRRDNYRCVECGMTLKEHYKKFKSIPNVHHKDHNHYNDVSENCETLCSSCHIRKHRLYESKQAELEYIDLALSI